MSFINRVALLVSHHFEYIILFFLYYGVKQGGSFHALYQQVVTTACFAVTQIN